jgi:putative hydrolase
VEANILSLQGNIEMEAHILKRLDFVMAGFHEICFESQGLEGNTQAMVAALANPSVDAISHPGNPAFPIDLEAVVRAAKQYGKALELNDSSFRIRKGSEKNCATLARLCVDQGTLMVVGSDAHYWRDVGRFGNVQSLLKNAGVPKHLVINSSVSAFEGFIAQRKVARQNLS